MTKSSRPSRAEIASRTVLGIFGSYALASAASLAITRLCVGHGRAAISLGELVGFTLFGLAAILAFSTSSASRAWMTIGGATLALGAVALVAGSSGA